MGWGKPPRAGEKHWRQQDADLSFSVPNYQNGYAGQLRLIPICTGSLLPSRSFRKIGLGKSEVISLSKSMMHLDFSPDLSKINCRALVLCGEKDRGNKPASMELAKRISGAQLSFVSGSGHEVNVDAPTELGRILHAFWTSQ